MTHLPCACRQEPRQEIPTGREAATRHSRQMTSRSICDVPNIEHTPLFGFSGGRFSLVSGPDRVAPGLPAVKIAHGDAAVRTAERDEIELRLRYRRARRAMPLLPALPPV